jgi:hypothetical protein
MGGRMALGTGPDLHFPDRRWHRPPPHRPPAHITLHGRILTRRHGPTKAANIAPVIKRPGQDKTLFKTLRSLGERSVVVRAVEGSPFKVGTSSCPLQRTIPVARALSAGVHGVLAGIAFLFERHHHRALGIRHESQRSSRRTGQPCLTPACCRSILDRSAPSTISDETLTGLSSLITQDSITSTAISRTVQRDSPYRDLWHGRQHHQSIVTSSGDHRNRGRRRKRSGRSLVADHLVLQP